MCNRYRVSAKQLDLARQYGFPIDQLMPDPERMPPPELFPKKRAGSFASMKGLYRWR